MQVIINKKKLFNRIWFIYTNLIDILKFEKLFRNSEKMYFMFDVTYVKKLLNFKLGSPNNKFKEFQI